MNQSQYQQSMDFFQTGYRICFGLAAAAFVTSVILFFVFNIPSILMIRREFIRCGMIRKKGRKRLAEGGILGARHGAGTKRHDRQVRVREKDTPQKAKAAAEADGIFTARSCDGSAGDRRRDAQTTRLLGLEDYPAGDYPAEDYPAEAVFQFNNDQKAVFNQFECNHFECSHLGSNHTDFDRIE